MTLIKIAGATVGATAHTYAAGQLVGGKITLTGVVNPSRRDPVLCAVTVQDLTKQNSALNLIFFDANPAATTFTDNAAFDLADADITKVIAIAPVAASDYVSLNDNSVGCARNLALPIESAAGDGDMYMCVICAGAPTYAANELSLVLQIV